MKLGGKNLTKPQVLKAIRAGKPIAISSKYNGKNGGNGFVVFGNENLASALKRFSAFVWRVASKEEATQ